MFDTCAIRDAQERRPRGRGAGLGADLLVAGLEAGLGAEPADDLPGDAEPRPRAAEACVPFFYASALQEALCVWEAAFAGLAPSPPSLRHGGGATAPARQVPSLEHAELFLCDR